MKINEIISETTAGAVATVAEPLGGMRKRPNPSIFGKAKKKVKEGEARDRAAKILHDLVEPMIDDFNSMDELESYMSDNMPDFYKGRDTNKAIEDAISMLSHLDLPEGKSPHKKGTKKYKAHMAAMHAG